VRKNNRIYRVLRGSDIGRNMIYQYKHGKNIEAVTVQIIRTRSNYNVYGRRTGKLRPYKLGR